MAIKYYVRKSWEDTSTQQGAYNVLSNAVAVCDSDTDYRVYDAAGTLIYNPLYYVRPSWADADKQSGAYRVYANATADADKRRYRVYDYLGVPRYPIPFTVQLTAATPYYTAADGAEQAGTASKGIYTITEIKSPYGYLKSGAGWLDLRNLDVYGAEAADSATPLSLAANNVADVYGCAIGCKHVSGSYTWATAMSKKQVNCAIVASRVAYLAGLTGKDKLISHTTAVKSNITTQKGTISKAMSGYSNLDLTKCSVKWVGKTYANLAAKYKVPGAIYVYDSNIAVCGGDGVIYSCNNGSNQLSNGVYVKNAMTSGYCFTSPVLVVILPNS
ncbi:MAG: hypothetical protein LUG55_02085 [Clostridiales bacterium]|nr:hypothetical protein [Clostridiales bacterium]